MAAPARLTPCLWPGWVLLLPMQVPFGAAHSHPSHSCARSLLVLCRGHTGFAAATLGDKGLLIPGGRPVLVPQEVPTLRGQTSDRAAAHQTFQESATSPGGVTTR